LGGLETGHGRHPTRENRAVGRGAGRVTPTGRPRSNVKPNTVGLRLQFGTRRRRVRISLARP
jgi:hypothetical protein